MGVINTAYFAKLLWPGLNTIYGQTYNEFKPQWPEIFGKFTSKKAYEQDQQITGMGLAQVKTEGADISFDEMKQGFTTTYTHVVYGLGFIITREMIEDNQYKEVGLKRAEALAFSMRQTKETVAANILNRAFNSSYTYGDGKELCATDHPNFTGGTWRNELSTAADLSEAALEQALIDIGDFKTDRGLSIQVKARKLIIPSELQFEAERILKNPNRPETANRDINAIYTMGAIPEGYSVNNYLTDPDAWFILTDIPKRSGLRYFERRADEFESDNDWSTQNLRFLSTARYSFGASDGRAIFGSPGA